MKYISRILIALLIFILCSCHATTGMAKTGMRLGTVACGIITIGIIDLVVRTKRKSKKNNQDLKKRTMKNLINILGILTLLLLSSCEVIGGIFKTGMGVGVILTIAVVIGIIALIMKMTRGGNKE